MLTYENLQALSADLKKYIGERFEANDKLQDERISGINRRLDILNGSVARHEKAIGEERARVDALVQPPAKTDDRPAITKGDVKRALKYGGAMVAGFEFIWRSGEIVAWVSHLVGRV